MDWYQRVEKALTQMVMFEMENKKSCEGSDVKVEKKINGNDAIEESYDPASEYVCLISRQVSQSMSLK